MSIPDQLNFRMVQCKGMPKDYADREAAVELGSKLFTELLGQGHVVVKVEKRKGLAIDRLYSPGEPQTEHQYRAKLTPVQYDLVRMPKIEYFDPEPKIVEKTVYVDRLVQAPPPLPWYARVGKFLAAEWERAGTNPGVEYVP